MKQLSQKKNKIIKLWVCISAIILAVTVLVLYVTVLKPKPVEGEKNVSLLIKYQNKTYEYNDLTTEKLYVLDFLLEYNETLELSLEYDTSAFGSYVTSLKSTKEDLQNGYYYTYTVNDQYADGISIQPIMDGDVICFSYTFEVWEQNDDGEWTVTDRVYQSGGDETLLSLPKKMDIMLVSLVFLLLLIVIASLIYVAITFKKQKSNKE